jgi:pSer/pThr/pTyr-binding forkhead associated (FHA) protein
MPARKSHPGGDEPLAARPRGEDVKPTRVRAAPPAPESPRCKSAEKNVPSDDTAPHDASRIRLDVIAGPDAGKSRRLRGVRTVVGRSQNCDLRVFDGSISRRHLEVLVSDECVLVRDLGSGNGTRVNGRRIAERVLRDQDEIAIGRTRLRFVDESGPLRRSRRTAAPAPAAGSRAPARTTPPSRNVVSAARVPALARNGRTRTVLLVSAALVAVTAVAVALAVRPLREAVFKKAGAPSSAARSTEVPAPPPEAPAPPLEAPVPPAPPPGAAAPVPPPSAAAPAALDPSVPAAEPAPSKQPSREVRGKAGTKPKAKPASATRRKE